MRHSDKNRKFGRERNQRNALLKSLVRSIIIHEGIDTTEAKAKEIRPHVEKLVTLAKQKTLASRRIVASRVVDDRATKKLVGVIAPKYADRKGGYTRVIKLPRRQNDAAKMARVEFV
jgi:large subunit ribosomal protein L17